MFKVNNRNTRVVVVSVSPWSTFEHISHLFLVFLSLTLNRQMFTEYASCEKPLWVSEQSFFDFFTDTLMFSFIKKIYDFQWYLFSIWSVTLRK